MSASSLGSSVWPLWRRLTGAAPFALAGSLLLWLGRAAAGEQVGEYLYAYLVAWLFFVSLALGSLFFVLTQHVSRAAWSVAIRRPAEHLMATMPMLALLFLPIWLGADRLYSWAGDQPPESGARAIYLDDEFFLARTIAYLVLWSGVAVWLRRRSVAQDQTRSIAASGAQRAVAAPALILVVASATFAAFDWILSLGDDWYSTIFGVYFLSGAAVGGLAALIVLVLWPGVARPRCLERWKRTPPPPAVNADLRHDLGKLLFGFMVFWAYIAFSQFMLIWYADLPEETAFFAIRLTPAWIWPTRLLVIAHFVLPFFLMLSQRAKRHRGALLGASIWLLAAHYVDLYWLVMPGHRIDLAGLRLFDGVALLGVGSLFAAAYVFLARGGAPVAVGDPRLSESAPAAVPSRTL